MLPEVIVQTSLGGGAGGQSSLTCSGDARSKEGDVWEQECRPLDGKAPQAQQEGLQALAPLLTPHLPALLLLTQQLNKNNG